MPINIQGEPVGTPTAIEKIENLANELATKWDSYVQVEKPKWYAFWAWGKSKVSSVEVSKFLLFALDQFIQFAEKEIPGSTGADKKATVLLALAGLYDYVTVGTLPIWLLPFSSQFKMFLIYVIASGAIDVMVDKYNNGNWKPTNG